MDWKKRIDSMDKLQKIIAGNSKHKYIAAFSAFMLKSVVPLTAQVISLPLTASGIRSTVCNSEESSSNNRIHGNRSEKLV